VASIADADPIAEVLSWLQAHPTVLAEFGGPGHISGLNEPPYPHVRVASSGGGDDGDLTWVVSPEVLVETYADPDGMPGQAELRRLHYVALLAAVELPRRAHTAEMTVVSSVLPSSTAAAVPLPLGQLRWTSALRVTLHPAIA
jgi:hypothetical protein